MSRILHEFGYFCQLFFFGTCKKRVSRHFWRLKRYNYSVTNIFCQMFFCLKLDLLDSWIYQDCSSDNGFPENSIILEILLLITNRPQFIGLESLTVYRYLQPIDYQSQYVVAQQFWYSSLNFPIPCVFYLRVSKNNRVS